MRDVNVYRRHIDFLDAYRDAVHVSRAFHFFSVLNQT